MAKLPKPPKPAIELVESAIGAVVKAVGKVVKVKGPTKAAQRAASKRIADSEFSQMARFSQIQQDKKLINSARKTLRSIEVNEANAASPAYRSMREVGLTKRGPSSPSRSASIAQAHEAALQKRWANQSARYQELVAAVRALPAGPARTKARKKMRDYQIKTGFR